jgi:glucokinase
VLPSDVPVEVPSPVEPSPADAGLDPAGGQPSVLAIDLGVRHLAVGVTGRDGGLGVRDRIVTPTREPLRALLRLIDRVMAATPETQRPTVCGVTAPGPVVEAIGEFRPLGIPTWHGVPLRREIKQLTGLDTVLESIGRAYATVAAAGGSAVALHLGDQVDGGIVVDGRLLDGATGHAGMFGHLAVEHPGAMCVCGAPGCLEAYASARTIEEQTGRDLARTPAAIVERAGIMVGRACASLAAMLDQREIVLGGPVVAVLRDAFVDAVRAEFEQRCRLSHLDGVGVRVAQFHVLSAPASIARRLLATEP